MDRDQRVQSTELDGGRGELALGREKLVHSDLDQGEAHEESDGDQDGAPVDSRLFFFVNGHKKGWKGVWTC